MSAAHGRKTAKIMNGTEKAMWTVIFIASLAQVTKTVVTAETDTGTLVEFIGWTVVLTISATILKKLSKNTK